MNDVRSLPAGFEALEPFVAKWARQTVDERLSARCESSMDEIRAFYDAAIDRAPEMLTYLDQFALDDLPEDAGCLLRLLLALAQASVAVEIQGQPLPVNCRYPMGVSLTAGVHPFG